MTTVTDLRVQAEAAASRFAAAEAQLGADDFAGRVALSREVIRWANESFAGKVTAASSMGDEVLVHLIGTTVEGADVFFIDTGYHFAETIGTRDFYADMLPIRLRTVRPRQSVAEQDAQYGARLHERSPDQCCAMRKVAPLADALTGFDAWVTGMRRAEAITRTDIALVGWDERRSMVKINPIALWSDDDVARYASENNVFLNPLRQIGYTSIGCAPCTRPVAEGEDGRAGRWSGTGKVECGLHT